MGERSPAYSFKRAAFLSVISAVFFTILFRLTPPIVDEGIFVGGAYRVLHGDLPYRDFFEVTFPGSIYWLTLLFSLFGTSSWIVRASLIAVSIGIILAIDWISCANYRGEYDFLPALFYMFTALPMWPAISQHWDSTLFALLATGFFLTRTNDNDKGKLALSGFLVGLTSLCQQQKGVAILLTMIFLLVFEHWRTRGSHTKFLVQILSLTLPYLMILTALFGYFWSQGALENLIESTLLFPLKNYSTVNHSTYGYWFIESHIPSNVKFTALLPGVFAPVLLFLFLLPYFIYLFLPIVVLAAIAIIAKKRGSFDTLITSGNFPLTVLALGFFLSEMHRRTLFNIVWASPLLVVSLFLLWQHIWRHKKRWSRPFLMIVFLSSSLVGLQHTLVALSGGVPQTTRQGSILLPKTDLVLQTILKHSHPDESAFIYPFSSNYYFLAGLKNPTKLSFFTYGLHTKDQFRETIEMLDSKRIQTVFWDTAIDEKQLTVWLPGYKQPPESERIIESYLNEKYEPIALENGIRVMRRKP